MASGRIISVSTGGVADLLISGRPGSSGIGRPVPGRVEGTLGLAGDAHADNENHGGPEQAIYADAREDLDWWTERLGRGLRNGESGRPGAYLRVLGEGTVGAGDEIEVLARQERRVTVAESMRAYYGDAELMRALATVPGRSAKWDEVAERVLGLPRAGGVTAARTG